MEIEPVLQVLEHFHIPVELDGQEANMRCPFHEESTPSCGINIVTGLWHCFGCGLGGRLEDFVARLTAFNSFQVMTLLYRLRKQMPDAGLLGGIDPVTVYKTIKGPKEVVEAWKSFRAVNWQTLPYNHTVAQYLIGERGFSRKFLEAFGIRLTDDAEYPVVFPIMQGDTMVGYVKRRIGPGKKKYLYNEGFPGQTAMAYHKFDNSTLLVVEGFLDYMKASQFGVKHCAGILGWRIKEAQVRFLLDQGVSEVICGLDNTVTGRQGEEILWEHFSYVHPFPWPSDRVKDMAELCEFEFNMAWHQVIGTIESQTRKGQIHATGEGPVVS
jgi:hypothetical protein